MKRTILIFPLLILVFSGVKIAFADNNFNPDNCECCNMSIDGNYNHILNYLKAGQPYFVKECYLTYLNRLVPKMINDTVFTRIDKIKAAFENCRTTQKIPLECLTKELEVMKDFYDSTELGKLYLEIGQEYNDYSNSCIDSAYSYDIHAIDIFESLEDSLDLWKSNFTLGTLYLTTMKHPDSALDIFKKIENYGCIKDDSYRQANLHSQIALAYKNKGEYKNSVDCYYKCIDLYTDFLKHSKDEILDSIINNDLFGIYNSLAYVYAYLDKKDSALIYFQNYGKYYPKPDSLGGNDEYFNIHYAGWLRSLGYIDEAKDTIASVEKNIEKMSDYSDKSQISGYLSLYYNSIGEYEKSAEKYKNQINFRLKFNPDDTINCFDYAILMDKYIKAGQDDSANAYFKKAFGKCGDDDYDRLLIYYSMSEAYYEIEDYTHALRTLSMARECPDETGYWYYEMEKLYAYIYQKSGNYSKALEHWGISSKLAVKHGKNNESIVISVSKADTYFKLNELEKALEEYKNTVKLMSKFRIYFALDTVNTAIANLESQLK